MTSDGGGGFWIASKGFAKFTVDVRAGDVDLDGVDPLWAPGVSTPVPGGLTYREAHLLLEMVAARGILRSMEFVEVNPMYDNNHQTARLTIELALSALGKAIV